MNNIKKYILLSDSIRTVEDSIQKKRGGLDDEVFNLHLRELIIKVFLFYGLALNIIPLLKEIDEINALFLEYNAFIGLVFFFLLDFIFFKFIIKKNKNRFSFRDFSLLLLLGCIVIPFLSSQIDLVLVFAASIIIRMIFIFNICFFSQNIFFKFFTNRNDLRLVILNMATELRSSKNNLRELKRKKEALIKDMAVNESDMRYIISLKKGELDFEHKLVSTDKNKKIIREEFSDVMDCFIRTNSPKSEDEHLERLFKNKFEDVRILND